MSPSTAFCRVFWQTAAGIDMEAGSAWAGNGGAKGSSSVLSMVCRASYRAAPAVSGRVKYCQVRGWRVAKGRTEVFAPRYPRRQANGGRGAHTESTLGDGKPDVVGEDLRQRPSAGRGVVWRELSECAVHRGPEQGVMTLHEEVCRIRCRYACRIRRRRTRCRRPRRRDRRRLAKTRHAWQPPCACPCRRRCRRPSS